MGYAMMIGHCIGCGQPLAFNPHKVPSVRVEGKREPVCKACIDKFNPIRKAHGVPEITPHPEAYEPIEENEL